MIQPETLMHCPLCEKLVEPIEHEDYEHGQFPTAYETFFICPICKTELDPERDYDERFNCRCFFDDVVKTLESNE